MKINPMKALIELKQKLEEEKQKIEEIQNRPCYGCIFYKPEFSTCLSVHQHDLTNNTCYISQAVLVAYLNENEELFKFLARIKNDDII